MGLTHDQTHQRNLFLRKPGGGDAPEDQASGVRCAPGTKRSRDLLTPEEAGGTRKKDI